MSADALGSARTGALVCAVIGLVLCVICTFLDPQQLFLSYLAIYVFLLGLALGSLAMLMVHRLTGGGWGWLIRGPLLAAIRTLPLLAVLFVPLLFGLHDLYSWTRPETTAYAHLIERKSWYLNVPFFVLRAVLYFGVWIGLAYWLERGGSEQHAQSAHAHDDREAERVSAGGLIAYGLTVTFAAIDWSASLVPEFYSTVFGFIFAVAQMLGAMAFASLCAAMLARREDVAPLATAQHFHDLGNLLLMLILSWAYLAFMQFLQVWLEDLPHEIAWYVPRVQSSWQWIGLFLIVFHFALPFVLLLFRAVKRRVSVLAGIAAMLLVANLVNAFWLVVPPFRAEGFALYWSDLAALLALGGVWLLVLVTQIAAGAPTSADSGYAGAAVDHG